VAVTDPVYQPGTAFAAAVDAIRAGTTTLHDAAAALLAQLTDDELLRLLDGDLTLIRGSRQMSGRYNGVPFEGGRLDRLGIPGIRFTDGPRGIVMGSSTSFPVAIARAAAFDVDLERRIGEAIGVEGRALDANLFAGVCVNVPPFPGWGRSQESYGEDPVLTGAMGAALTGGVHPWLMTCVKHFALNSMEEARFTVDVSVDGDVLHEVYLPHFRTVVEAGADAVMSAYNSVNGAWAGENRTLLTGILRDTWGFTGFVMTDFVFGLRHPVESVAAGQDLEMPFRQQRAATLPKALRAGRLARADVERAATRLLSAQLRFALRARPAEPAGVVANPDHRRLAREAAARGTVLLRNDPAVLPLDAATLDSIAVLGRRADEPNLGDTGSSQVRPPDTVSVLRGLRERLGDRVRHLDASEVDAVRAAGAAVVVVGFGPADEGEAMVGVDTDTAMVFGGLAKRRWIAAGIARLLGFAARRTGVAGGDRRDLHLHRADVELVAAVAAANPRTIVVVIAGGTVMLDPWDDSVAAILLAWYPGMEGGRAIADLLLGDAEPTGRLPVAIPRRRADLPEVDWNARQVTYPRWFGQRKLDRDGTAAAYPFGFGLGYTTFRIADVAVEPVDGERFRATVTVTNTGARAGRHVVQVYATQTEHPNLPTRALVGFATVECPAGASATVTVDATTRPLQVWTGKGFRLGVTTVGVEAASYAGDPGAVRASVTLVRGRRRLD
jgi:beta-glucosidase